MLERAGFSPEVAGTAGPQGSALESATWEPFEIG